jgi:hypothetical protein
MSAAASEYHVAYSGQVKEKLKDLLRKAKKAGKLSRFAIAAEKMDERLRTDPWSFGELTGKLPWSKAPIHVAFLRPLKVDFAIYETEKMVFVRKIEAVTSIG